MDHSVTHGILQQYFTNVNTLYSYLKETLIDNHQPPSLLESESDDPVFRHLLRTAYVATHSSKAVTWAPNPFMTVKEVIERSQEILYSRKIPNHIITQGYKPARGSKGSGSETSKRSTSNTIVTSLQGPEWALLFERIGIDAMVHLLTETSTFVSLPNGCLCQMTGPILLYSVLKNEREKDLEASKRKRERSGVEGESHERHPKRLKVSSMALDYTRPPTSMRIRSPVDVSFARQRIFYARPSLTPSRSIVVGLPANHILNRIRPSIGSRPSKPPEPREETEHSQLLAKYVFSRQYGLSSAFMFEVSKWEPSYIPDFANRDIEIERLRTCKTPKRLREVLPLLQKLLWRHGKCKYRLLRDLACPSKVSPELQNDADGTMILEMMSEHSSELRSQISLKHNSFDSEGNTISLLGLTQAQQAAKSRPRFMDFACNYSEVRVPDFYAISVYKYVIWITNAVIPKRFWGSRANFKAICRHIKNFVVSRRYETLSLHQVLQGFNTSDCEWLMPPGDGKKQMRVSVSDSLKRRELLEDFIFWFFDSFVISLIRATFYVTDTSAFRNQVLYFRLDDWEKLCAPLIDRLTNGTFERLDANEVQEVLKQRELGFSYVRFLPKETGVRPIVNLRRKQTSMTGPQVLPQNRSINQILQAAFRILNYEKETQSHLIGASTSGDDDVYVKLKNFKQSLRRVFEGKLPRLYFVKMDVQACFDTIDQQKLLEILRTLISQEGYAIQRYGQVSTIANRPKRSYLKKARPDDDPLHFLQFARDLANILRNIIFVDQVVYPSTKAHAVLELLEQHITENIVKIGTAYYRQVVGIPQGSVLSSILCSFFYGDLERRADFPPLLQDPRSLLMRHTDDYLLITADAEKADQFLQVMNRGHPEYGCFVSKDKTLTNFDYDEQILNVVPPKQTYFPWCGYVINMTDLSVGVEYERYTGSNLSDSLTVARGRSSGRAFMNKMLLLAKRRSHVIYTDSTLNSKHAVHLNIYQHFLLSAMKMDGYIRDWDGKLRRETEKLIRNTTQQMFSHCYSAIRSKALNHIAKLNECQVEVQKADVMWLGAHAFHRVLSRRPNRYLSLLRSLAFDLNRGKNHNRYKRFRNVLRGALENLKL
ncbi:hypothetical protein D9757_002434 [Collybiopsis confluens]|uniref:Telomerase reverse transcriptase n=1 Tax=Collybiopsis confluens TaxID=2823264 RepID=A0A8H5HY00_9AGAR|nr:hypothetical protein D9757_002434 [Collybiopsis confluens]